MLPCWDESDDGLLPCCVGDPPVEWWKVFNPLNKYTNDNLLCIMLGNVGFKYFDERRQYWMGAAMWSTLISIPLTIWGCMALSGYFGDPNKGIIKDTHWTWVNVKNEASKETFQVYLGLAAFVYVHEPCHISYQKGEVTCSEDTFLLSDDANLLPNAWLNDGFGDCRTTTVGAQQGSFTTCATLVFALIGTQTRMKFVSDANVQKALGMITDLCGFISLAATLYGYYTDCYLAIKRQQTIDDEDYRAEVYLGPGYFCYLVCLFGAFMRALFHWLTPLAPRPDENGKMIYHGSGCAFGIPKNLIDALDENGDGKISCSELTKLSSAYDRYRQQKNTERRLSTVSISETITEEPKASLAGNAA
mmetsp:Transcript_77305/g.222440  ORF Transcript_77305/g.222440 Transcript_77305/m.222440 type:complete len:361 (+) Transcript_77305:492-1574(+)